LLATLKDHTVVSQVADEETRAQWVDAFSRISLLLADGQDLHTGLLISIA
jgi:hypothetical protein